MTKKTDEPPETLGPEEEIIAVDGRDVVILKGKLNADKTLSATYDYLLRGAVFVEGGATLTIEPGVKIFGEAGEQRYTYYCARL